MEPTPYYAVGYLITAADANWQGIDGTAAAGGVDPGDLPLGRFCNYVHVWFAERMDDTQFRMFEAQLATPPDNTPTGVAEMTVEEEGQAFLAFASALSPGGGVDG